MNGVNITANLPLETRNTALYMAVAVSIAVHCVVLAVKFVVPEAFRMKPTDSPLEVILVNAKSSARPVNPTALAQADLDGGGEHDKGRATSFLPRAERNADGDILHKSQSTVARMEAEQERLLTQFRQSAVTVRPDNTPKKESNPMPAPIDLITNARQIARMEAQLEKQITDYNARPRRQYISPSTRSVSYAFYYNQWKEKIERFGTINYPAEARGKLYGDLVLTVTLNLDGSIYNDEITITRSSGYPVLDRAARRIVRLASPFSPFPPEMRADFDVFEITTRFSFTRGDGFEAELGTR